MNPLMDKWTERERRRAEKQHGQENEGGMDQCSGGEIKGKKEKDERF